MREIDKIFEDAKWELKDYEILARNEIYIAVGRINESGDIENIDRCYVMKNNSDKIIYSKLLSVLPTDAYNIMYHVTYDISQEDFFVIPL